MSANNAIVVLKTLKGFKVSHCLNPFNLDKNDIKSFDYWFENKPCYRSKTIAMKVAKRIKNKINSNPNSFLEYGLMFVDITPQQLDMLYKQ